MITYVATDLFQSPARTLVNTVNTVGVMGKGVAKVFKTVYPDMFIEYQKLCEQRQFDIGQLWLYRSPSKWVLNIPTKRHWRQPSKPEYIEAALEKFVGTYAENRITTISFPLLGCGNGELDWETQVRPLMEKYLKRLPIEVFIHTHQVKPLVPEHYDPEAIRTWLREEPQALAFAEVWDDLRSVLSRKREFTTLGSGEVFYAEAGGITEEIVITTKRQKIIVPYDPLLDLWQHIRGFGFCMQGNMPSGLDNYGTYIVAIMSELAYLRPVVLSKDYADVTKTNSKAIGLQLIPYSSPAAGPLFTQSRELEPV